MPRGRPPHPDQLTPAEWRVVEMVRHGQTNPAIARRLGVSPDAVKFHVASVLAKLALPNRAALRRWAGVRKDSPLYRKDAAMIETKLALGSLGQIARSVSNITAAEGYYKDVLGLPHLFTFGDLAFFDCGGVRLMLSAGNGAVAESILYFRVDDIHTAHAALSGKGVAFRQAPHLIHKHPDGTEEWMAFFDDNDGRPLGLMAQVRA